MLLCVFIPLFVFLYEVFRSYFLYSFSSVMFFNKE